jgi:hypothetical protein
MENFMDTIPDTSGYMTAGFIVTFVTMGIYVLSLYIRNQNLKRDVDTLESLQAEKPKSKK